ncbi:hypothetical protein RM530_01385 [Algiphilus sp. W345]|uniref:Transposase n=1 Tax=Banduia mediterranea TaxID=3075609 RepID=A0ABU2WDU4_9GAMM|nr:hypothetical protein [Algiphilus sp. W345]MDT0496020.1 hypothetical protein [Algiphilus sp. W345]
MNRPTAIDRHQAFSVRHPPGRGRSVTSTGSRRLKATRETLFDAVQGELTASHVFVLRELMAHKLLRTVFYMLSRNQPYRNTVVDYQARSVKRNAPRWIKALTQYGFIATQA